ncbi:hypothetical protein D3Y57_12085 [Sphingomonas paeninsulae]|uniref:Acyltransferase 3 domain-containing protein n=1 Tax=Sphingomonas paeninsulae TaxID=2319844 RepID=A0A494TGX8_SPHPE|nr:acyltransferase family protein [Sphingomonas paeninsulae]AYJ86572.1 hypothetical protein D3Y57_12085 [Sphingomonas paeninsulae]
MTSERIDGLDVWRAVFLTLGVCLHTTDAKHVPAEYLIQILSSMFRMGAFMAIAGVLSGIVLHSRHPRVWFHKKMIQLGIPMLVGLLVTNTLLYPLTHSIELYHMWFLISLLVYCTILYIGNIYFTTREYDVTSYLDISEMKLVPAMLVVMAFTIVTVFATQATFYVLPAMKRVSDLTCETVQYVAPFLLGYFYGKYQSVRDLANSNNVALVILIICSLVPMSIFVYIYGYEALDGFGQHQTIIKTFTYSSVMYPIICLILQQAFKIRNYSEKIIKFSKSSYTIYLIHFPIAGYALVYIPSSSSYLLDYIIRIAFVLTASYWFHLLVVRSKLMTFLFNGKPMRVRARYKASLGAVRL